MMERRKVTSQEKEILRYLSVMEDTFLAIDAVGRKKASTWLEEKTWNFACAEANREDGH